jgi:hypothetical protein
MRAQRRPFASTNVIKTKASPNTPPPHGSDTAQAGRTRVRQWGDFMTASGEIS